MTTATAKLKIFREKIDRTTSFGEQFRQLISIELFAFIQAEKILKVEFDRRAHYLKNLADDKDFNLLQDNLFEIIQKILKLTSPQEVQERQKEYNNKLINKLKTRYGSSMEEQWFLTLPEMYVALQKKDNYYRLGDSSYFSPEEEISILTHVAPVKNQYKTVEAFFERAMFDTFSGDKKKQARYEELIGEYNDYWYKFDECIYCIPIRLHLQTFERFFYDCVSFYPQQGYEFFYELFSGASEQNSIAEKQAKEAQASALVVIDDLIETLEVEDETNEKQSSQNGKGLQSIHLITNALEPTDAIFLVLDELFDTPIRYEVKNSKGKPTYIKKLYDIAYNWNAPNKKVDYDRNIADCINNGLFRRTAVAKYIKTNKFQTPTLVQKSGNGTLVLKNDIRVKTELIKNIPQKYQSLYIDKTK